MLRARPGSRPGLKRLPPRAEWQHRQAACHAPAEPAAPAASNRAVGMGRCPSSGNNIRSVREAKSRSRSRVPRGRWHSNLWGSSSQDHLSFLVAPPRLAVGSQLRSNNQPLAKTGAGSSPLPAKQELSEAIGPNHTSAQVVYSPKVGITDDRLHLLAVRLSSKRSGLPSSTAHEKWQPVYWCA
jgi:hypothetical protein